VRWLTDKARQYYKGDPHQREVLAYRAVVGFLSELGPFDSPQAAFYAFVNGKGDGKAHARNRDDGGIKDYLMPSRGSKPKINGKKIEPFYRVR